MPAAGIDDFLWFVANPAYDLARFDPVSISWHKHWLWVAPVDYWVSLCFASLLFWLSWREKAA